MSICSLKQYHGKRNNLYLLTNIRKYLTVFKVRGQLADAVLISNQVLLRKPDRNHFWAKNVFLTILILIFELENSKVISWRGQTSKYPEIFSEITRRENDENPVESSILLILIFFIVASAFLWRNYFVILITTRCYANHRSVKM